MKKTIFTFLFVLAISPLLVQCASQDELNQIHYQLRMLNKKVSDLETGPIDNLQKRQASSASQMDQLYKEFLQIKSGMDESGHLNRRLTEQNKELENAFKSYAKSEEEKRKTELKRLELEIQQKDQSIETLAQQLKVQQDNLNAIQQARVQDAKRKADAAARAAAAAKAKAIAANKLASGTTTRIRADKKKILINASSSSPSVPGSSSAQKQTVQKPSPAASSPKTKAVSSGNGAELYKRGKYREAYRAFEQISKANKDNEVAINARYMMGESLFALKEYDQAILDYQHIITNNPSSNKAPAAMLRQGMAFEKLNDSDTARILYQKLIASYKKSPEAAKAKEILDKM